uniref:Uncharacterized protein n=1 Tax=Sphaerodactylus townsendi TaxID=933632 RepID=A0ACB8G0P3_9SAUR
MQNDMHKDCLICLGETYILAKCKALTQGKAGQGGSAESSIVAVIHLAPRPLLGSRVGGQYSVSAVCATTFSIAAYSVGRPGASTPLQLFDTQVHPSPPMLSVGNCVLLGSERDAAEINPSLSPTEWGTDDWYQQRWSFDSVPRMSPRRVVCPGSGSAWNHVRLSVDPVLLRIDVASLDFQRPHFIWTGIYQPDASGRMRTWARTSSQTMPAVWKTVPENGDCVAFGR